MNNYISLIQDMLARSVYGNAFLEKQVRLLLQAIYESQDIDDAEVIFKNCQDIQFELARACFKDGTRLSDFLREFVYYFERLDDVEYKSHLYTKIKSTGKAW